MQKNIKKASILIWSIFLSLIISISFLSISTKITKNLKNSKNINNNLELEQKINNAIKNSNNDYEQIDNIIIKIENKTLTKSLKKDEILKINFLNNSNITLKLLNSGVIFYNTGGTNTGILDKNNTEIITTISSNKDLVLENYSGYSIFNLKSDNKFEINKKRYKIIKKIGNKQIIKSNYIK